MENELSKQNKKDPKDEEKKESLKNNVNTKSPKKDDKINNDKNLFSPDNKSMNQKYFPSKENYFGIKMSPEKLNFNSQSPHPNSPVFNYFSGISPKDEEDISPLKNIYGKNNNFKKLSYNFDRHPNIFLQENFRNQNMNNINMEEPKSLQERMSPFINTGNNNAYMMQNPIQRFDSNNPVQINKEIYEEEEQDEEEEEDDNEKAFTLTINNIDNKNVLGSIITNSSDINKDSDTNTFENKLSENKGSKKSITEKINNNIINKEHQVKNIINKKEFNPYIPNKFRNISFIQNYYQEPIPNNNYDFYNQNNNYMNIPHNYNNSNNYNNIAFQNYTKEEEPSQTQNFYYKGDNYQINNNKESSKENNNKKDKINKITQEDVVTTITSNNKIIKRINPNKYLNESIEFLASNILSLSEDQAGCRFLQEKIENDPEHTVEIFFKNLLPNIITISKDPFGNYLVQKLFPYMTPENFKMLLEKIAPNFYDLGSDNHGTRILQNLVNYLSTPELVNIFLNTMKPHLISLLKEMHGIHIVNKFIIKHPEVINEINKIVLNNCSLLATHKFGCFYLQRILDSDDKALKSELIKNLIDNCFVLIIDQFGNYVIQSILNLKISKYCSDIALIISDNAPYYSKHRYSCNVIEKCFDCCGKKERNILIEKLCTPEVIAELILDEHGNYVIQKALYYVDNNKKNEILKIINTMIPKIRLTSFGNKLLNRLYLMYPEMNNFNQSQEIINNQFLNNMNYGYIQGNVYKGFKKRYNNNYMNKFNNQEKESYTMKNKYDSFNNQNMNVNNANVSMNNIYNINNNTFNININSNSNIENKEENKKSVDKKDENIESNYKEKDDFNIFPEKKKKKKKKLKKSKQSQKELNSDNIDNINNDE